MSGIGISWGHQVGCGCDELVRFLDLLWRGRCCVSLVACRTDSPVHVEAIQKESRRLLVWNSASHARVQVRHREGRHGRADAGRTTVFAGALAHHAGRRPDHLAELLHASGSEAHPPGIAVVDEQRISFQVPGVYHRTDVLYVAHHEEGRHFHKHVGDARERLTQNEAAPTHGLRCIFRWNEPEGDGL